MVNQVYRETTIKVCSISTAWTINVRYMVELLNACNPFWPGNWICHLYPWELRWLHLVPGRVEIRWETMVTNCTSLNSIASVYKWKVQRRCFVSCFWSSDWWNHEVSGSLSNFLLRYPNLFNSCCFSSSESGTCFGTNSWWVMLTINSFSAKTSILQMASRTAGRVKRSKMTSKHIAKRCSTTHFDVCFFKALPSKRSMIPVQHANLLQNTSTTMHTLGQTPLSTHQQVGDPQSTSFPNPSSTLQESSTSKWHDFINTHQQTPSISTRCSTQAPTVGTSPYLAATSIIISSSLHASSWHLLRW